MKYVERTLLILLALLLLIIAKQCMSAEPISSDPERQALYDAAINGQHVYDDACKELIKEQDKKIAELKKRIAANSNIVERVKQDLRDLRGTNACSTNTTVILDIQSRQSQTKSAK